MIEDIAFVPERVDFAELVAARARLERDGAVILTGTPVGRDELVQVAAALLGARLRVLEEVRTRTTESGPDLELHTDGIHVAIDIHGQLTQLRSHDVEMIFVQCDTPAEAGGESVIADGYRLVERIREHRPDLYEFMTTVDLDFTSGVAELDAYRLPRRACRLVEWTRGGQLVVRAYPWAVLLPMDPHRSEHQRLLDEYNDLLVQLCDAAPRDRLQRGEVQVLHSYRCPHAVRAHEGTRRTHVLSCSTDAAL